MTNKTPEEKALDYVERITGRRVISRNNIIENIEQGDFYLTYIEGYSQCKEDTQTEVSELREALRGSLIMLEQLIKNTEGYFNIELDGYRKEFNKAKQLIKSKK